MQVIAEVETYLLAVTVAVASTLWKWMLLVLPLKGFESRNCGNVR